MAAIGGFVFGFDTSILSPAVIYLQSNEGMKPWSDGWKDALFSVNLGEILSRPGLSNCEEVKVGWRLVF